MSAHVSACCPIILNQQQQQNIHRSRNQPVDISANCKTMSKNCTVVEDGRVVVRPQIAVNNAE